MGLWEHGTQGVCLNNEPTYDNYRYLMQVAVIAFSKV